jgi:hypothetical protein
MRQHPTSSWESRIRASQWCTVWFAASLFIGPLFFIKLEPFGMSTFRFLVLRSLQLRLSLLSALSLYS